MELKISPPKNIASKKDCYSDSNGGEKCSIELGLNLELSYSKFSTNGYGFTFLQRQELEQQFCIYKYIEVGLPVPSHLIIPICKSITCSLKGLRDGVYQHCPNLMGYGHLCWELSMEPEPRRCWRTDGKKWRCSKSVIQNQKYCEKHMHRGRQRSRKYVEPASSNLQLSSSKIKSNKTMRVASQAHQNSEPDTTFSIALPIN
ncbi:growth-regulating factor 12-like [Lycium barbarum]|uniref:growth-regulating factor 12-like n=1 Tax=Lycium barbarum TaxID=112863 RepID=UPI00293EF64C|nr:growth-regulating factor 12-like [Lycium barbarum]